MKKYSLRVIAFVLCISLLFTGLLTACGEKPGKTVEYYVQYGASGDGSSPKSPASSVNEVKALINKLLGEKDTAKVWIMKPEIDGYNAISFANADAEEKNNQMAVWKKSSEKDISHTAKMIVQTYIPEGKKRENTPNEYLAFSELVGKDSGLTVSGPTEFKNVTLVPTSSTDWISTKGNNLTFGENLIYRYMDVAGGKDISDWKEIELSAESTDFTTLVSTDKDEVINDAVNITFANKPFNSGVFYLPSNKACHTEFREDVNIYYTSENSAAFKFVVGADEGEKTDYTATFKKNLNVKMKKAIAARIAPGRTSVLIEGAAQFITDPDSIYYNSNGKEYSFKNLDNLKFKNEKNDIVDAQKYILYVKSEEQDYINFVNGVAGEYEIADDYIAIATALDGKGEPVKSKNGKLVLQSGEYNVSITKDYTNDGETIKVYKSTKIDLKNVYHEDKEGYAFIGWRTEKGKVPKNDKKIKKGTTLTAQYIPLDFTIEDTKIKEGVAGQHSLMFIMSKGNKFYDALPKPLEYGSIYLPTNDTLGSEMYINEQVVHTWKWDKETGLNFEPSALGRTPIRVKSWNNSIKNPEIYEKTDKQIKYTLCIDEIDPDNYYTWYSVRGYIIYEDLNGYQRIVYTEQQAPDFEDNKSNYGKDQSCLYKVAKETPEDKRGEAENEIIKYVEVDRKDYYFSYTTISEYVSGYSGMGLKDENPDHKLYKLHNGLSVRDVTIKTGKGTEKTEICFIADSHFAHIDKKDIANNMINALSSYRGRSWTNNSDFRSKSINYMEYASMFDKIVIGGDAVDYLTYGSIGAVAKLITKKSVNGNIKMVLGNHEPSEMSQNDISGLSNVRTIEERYKMLADDWTNDPVYSSEIMKSKDGRDNIMMIYLDNGGQHAYNKLQLEKFKADITVARQKNLPVLIFQHIPLGTGVGQLIDVGDDEYTKALDSEIRKSADVVKGIFCGHMHSDSVDYLQTLNADGSISNNTIPQYTVAGAHYNNIMKITVE